MGIINFEITISQNPIKLTDNVKYLGVFVDNKLTRKTHIYFLSKNYLKFVV